MYAVTWTGRQWTTYSLRSAISTAKLMGGRVWRIINGAVRVLVV